MIEITLEVYAEEMGEVERWMKLQLTALESFTGIQSAITGMVQIPKETNGGVTAGADSLGDSGDS